MNLPRSAMCTQWAEIHVFEDHDEIDTEVVVAAAEVVVAVVCVGSATVFVGEGGRYSSCRQVFALLIYDNFEHKAPKFWNVPPLTSVHLLATWKC